MKIDNLLMYNSSSYNSFTNIIKSIWTNIKYILNHTFHPKYYYPEYHDTDSDYESDYEVN